MTTGVYSDNGAITITPLLSKENGHFFVVRHTDYTTTDSASYTVKLPTSAGEISIPQKGGSLSLHGRDSKFHVTDYPVGDHVLLYSTAEIFTWKKFADKTVLVLYGGPDELHEFALKKQSKSKTPYKINNLEGDDVAIHTMEDSSVVLQWKTSTTRQVVEAGDLIIYLMGESIACSFYS